MMQKAFGFLSTGVSHVNDQVMGIRFSLVSILVVCLLLSVF
jgi:hypothetical protein